MQSQTVSIQEQYPELFNQPTTSLHVVAPLLGISKTSAYKAVKDGTFPFPTLRIGGRIVVPTQPVRAGLGLEVA